MHAWRQPGGSGGRFGFRRQSSSTILTLLVINVSVALLCFFSPDLKGLCQRTFGLVPAKAIPQLHLWQFGTYMFLHGGLWHLAFNMFALWMFGSEIEARWGRQVFLMYYFFCGLGGGLVYTVTSWGSPIPLVGASGAIFGILLAYGLMFPDRKILLYFIFPIKAKYFVMIIGLFELLAAQQQRSDGIGHYAHLGGMLFGYFFLLSGSRGAGAGLGLSNLTAAWRRWRTRSRLRVVRPEPGNGRPEPNRDRVDEILEKISRKGLDSLTEEEQDILRKASRK
ncbi:MAG: rhomboid family intramembrane serine protease [bacterium]